MKLQFEPREAAKTGLRGFEDARERGRIAMVSTALGVGGGAEEQVMLLSLGLKARGWKVKIISLLPLFPLSAELEVSGIPISSLGMKRGVPDPRAIFGLIEELRGFSPDVVHSHMPQANILARAVRPFQPFPVLIGTLHSPTMERINGSSGRFLELAHRWTDRYSDLTTVICTPAVESYVEKGVVPADKIDVLYNGVNTDNFRANTEAREKLRHDLDLHGKFAWLAIGRFERSKAYPNMIRAFAETAANAMQDLVLLICGRGSQEEQIRAEIRACGVEKRVRFLGVRRDIPDVMNAADAFVMSSYTEGLPMVLLQATAVGMPIVTTNVGGNAEVVMDGLNGFVVPPGDDAALASAMKRVLDLPDEERARMAERGRQMARDKFEIQRILDRWEALYGELLTKKSGQRIR